MEMSVGLAGLPKLQGILLPPSMKGRARLAWRTMAELPTAFTGLVLPTLLGPSPSQAGIRAGPERFSLMSNWKTLLGTTWSEIFPF